MTARNSTVYFFSLVLAFCSLFYEFVYAHILSVCIGGTKTQYLLIISLFTFALGLGSIFQSSFRKKVGLKNLFFKVELALTILGGLGPFLVAYILRPGEASAFMGVKIFAAYFLIFLIGVLSGFEIPCLFDLLPDEHGKVLAFDYGGMLLASILFPFAFLPVLGAATGTLVVASLNLVAVAWLLPEKYKTFANGVVALALLGMVLSVCFKKDLNDVLSSIYLGQSV